MEKANTAIPLVIGITGHREISLETERQIYDTAHAMFVDLRNRYPNTPIRVLSSLGKGADMVCAEAALDAGAELVVPLPMPAEEYRKDFSGTEIDSFDFLLEKATKVFVVPQYEKCEDAESRGYFYRQAAINVVSHSHILFACWDGCTKPRADGAGTYETVRLMQEAPFFKKQDSALDQNVGMILQLVTPRENESALTDPFSLILFDGSVQTTLDKPALNLKSFDFIERFNRDIVKYEASIQGDMQKNADYCMGRAAQGKLSDEESLTLRIYAAADSIAVFLQRKRLLSLRLLALIGLCFVLFFLFYDELNAPLMLVGYGGLILIAVSCTLIFSKKRYHDKYVLYRVLAEAMRIQLYMDTANIFEFSTHIPWWKRTEELRFVNDTCRVMQKNEKMPFAPDCIKYLESCWIEPQLNYHENAIAGKGGKHQLNKRMANILLLVAVFIFIVVAIIEAAFPYIMDIEIPNFFRYVFPFVSDMLTWNSLFKILLGAVSAAAAFVANYYGKLALPEQIRGSERMYKLYSQVNTKLQAAANVGDLQTAKQILILLADKALEENLDWYAYYADNTPEFILG